MTKKMLNEKEINIEQYNKTVRFKPMSEDRKITIIESVELSINQAVLDIGCGTSIDFLHELLKEDVSIFGLDISINSLKYNKLEFQTSGAINKPYFAAGDVEYTPFKEGVFDVVFANYVLHHLRDPLPLLFEIRRVLKKDGILIINEENRYWSLYRLYYYFVEKVFKKKSWWRNPGFYHNWYTPYQLYGFIKQAGLKIIFTAGAQQLGCGSKWRKIIYDKIIRRFNKAFPLKYLGHDIVIKCEKVN